MTVRRRWIGATALVMIAAGCGVWFAFGRDDGQANPEEAAMAERAQRVMPFDLNRTTHTFTKTAEGGIQRVVANDISDTRDLDLIRSHLRTEAEGFRRGDYSDPATIHGMYMPGVAELQQGAARVEVVYADIRGGAQITYASTEPALIAALHAWFDRQASDHSLPGMGG